ncbi:MAG: hypothetical protein IPN76_18170 [Saprospiraceae bacterium]|nr:hypothetical protein [Saprospiraceae bacterium]
MKSNFTLLALLLLSQIAQSQSTPTTLLNEPLDISADFRDWANYYYFATGAIFAQAQGIKGGDA